MDWPTTDALGSVIVWAMPPSPLLPVALFAVATLTVLPTAYANGLSTHTWVTLRARVLVPDGPLADLVRDPALQDMLLSGTIFPDGGYAVGDGYGEAAHWEPFQTSVLEHIKATYAPPWSVEAREHIAFMLGMASHGMSDQIYDSMFMERARVYDVDSDWQESFDEATDVIWCGIVGAQPVPPRWLPTDLLIDLFKDEHGRTVERRILERGQNLAGLAVALVGMLSTDPVAIERYSARYPWASQHMEDPAAFGRPEADAQVVARYWARLWARLHGGQSTDDVVMATFPAAGGLGLARDAASVESRITLVFAHRLRTADVDPSRFELVDDQGQAHPFSTRLFYRDNSHVVHLIPEADFAEDTVYTVRVKAGLPTVVAGPLTSAFEMTVSTEPPPPPLPASGAAPLDVADSGCRCTGPQRSGAAGVLLGLPLLLWWRRR